MRVIGQVCQPKAHAPLVGDSVCAMAMTMTVCGYMASPPVLLEMLRPLGYRCRVRCLQIPPIRLNRWRLVSMRTCICSNIRFMRLQPVDSRRLPNRADASRGSRSVRGSVKRCVRLPARLYHLSHSNPIVVGLKMYWMTISMIVWTPMDMSMTRLAVVCLFATLGLPDLMAIKPIC